MKSKIEYCDVCGEAFSYPWKGDVVAGFGICDKCYEQEKRNEGDEIDKVVERGRD